MFFNGYGSHFIAAKFSVSCRIKFEMAERSENNFLVSVFLCIYELLINLKEKKLRKEQWFQL